MRDISSLPILEQWLVRLTEELDYLSTYKNDNNKYRLQYLEELLTGLGSVLNLEDLQNNWSARRELCSITKERIERAIHFAGGSYSEFEQKGCFTELRTKINDYISKTSADIDFEMDPQDTDMSGKILYLSLEKQLTKDKYELTRKNGMASGNYVVLISSFDKATKDCPIEPGNEWECYKKLLSQVVSMHNGMFKLRNDQTFQCNEAIFQYLTGKGYDSKTASSLVAWLIFDTYDKYNPYVDEHQVNIDDSITVTFSRRSRFPDNYFNLIVPYYQQALNYLPIELKSLAKRINIEDERNPYDLYWRSVYQDNHDSGATCDYTNGIINIYNYENDINSFYTQILHPNYIYTVLYHELGHAYDYHFAKEWGVETELISSSELWLNAMKEDQELNSQPSVSEYGNNASGEDFADTIYLYFVNPSVLDKFPNRKRLLDEKFKSKKYHPEINSGGVDLN